MLQRVYAWFAHTFEDQKPKGTIAVLDGVRALAFLIVLILHMGNMTSALGLWQQRQMPFVAALVNAGFSGVTLFFVLSGFLLFLPYAQALLFSKPWPSAKIFYMRRIFRIFPMYYFSLLLILLIGHRDYFAPSAWGKLWPFLTFTMGFWASQPIDGPYWTLAIEFQYYVLLPLIALAIAGIVCWLPVKRRGWGVIGCLLSIIVWGVATRGLSYYYNAHPHETLLVSRPILDTFLWIVYGQDGRYLDDFAVGMLVAVLYIVVSNSPKKDHYRRMLGRLVYGLFGLGLALFLLGALRHYIMLTGHVWPVAPRLVDMPSWMTELWFALAYGCLMIVALFARSGGRLQRFFAWDPLRWLGLLTYSLYIWHVPFIGYIQHTFGSILMHDLPVWFAYLMCWVLVLGISLPFSFVTYLFIEKPGMRFSENLRQKMLAKRAPQPTPTPPTQTPLAR